MLLRESRPRSRKGLADILAYGALVDDGVALNKDGSLLAGWTYRGPDLTCATAEELAALSAQVNRSLLLGDGWMLHADAIRLPAEDYPPPGHFPDPVTALVDDERRAQFQSAARNFTTRYTLVLTYLPPAEAKTRLLRWLFEGGRDRDRSADALPTFLRRLEEVEDILGSVLDLSRLDSEALLTHLHTCVTGLPHTVVPPPTPCYLDVVLASADLVGGFEPRIGDRHIGTISILGLPASTTSGILEPLQNLPFGYRWSNRFVFLDPSTAVVHIRRYRAQWFRSRRGVADLLRLAFTPAGPGGEDPKDGFGNRHSLQMAEDADIALAEASSGEVRYGYYTSTVVVTDPDPAALTDRCRQILRLARNAGFPAQLETTNAVEAFHGSLPGHGRTNIRRPLLHTLNLAHLVPTTAVYAGSATSANPHFAPASPALLWAATGGSTPFRFNLHAGSDVGHTLIVGPTGAGKSALVALLQAQWLRYADAQIVVFDKGGSSLPLVLAAGGDHYDIAADAASGFYPLQHVDEPAERAWAAEWIEALFETQNLVVNSSQRALIQRALELLAVYPERTLTAFASKLQDLELRAALTPFTHSGLFGPLFDSARDPLRSSHYSCFEMATLLEYAPRAVNLLLHYLFHRVEARLDGRPTLIVLEEAWTFLATPLFAQRIQAWLRELRKKNAAVVFVTQSLSELHNSPIRDVVYSSTPTKILLPNPEAQTEAGSLFYRSLGLNAQETRILATATPKKHYYVASPQGRRLIDLTLGPVALAFVGSTSREDLREVRELEREHGRRWPEHWLHRRNLLDQAARLAEFLSKEIPHA